MTASLGGRGLYTSFHQAMGMPLVLTGGQCAACRYVERPLLVSGFKFHIRAYVLCVGSLSVYVYSEALALLAGEAYTGYQCFQCQ